jgi:hypothetical protein
LRNRWVLVSLALILGGVLFIDYLSELLYPSTALGAITVPETVGGAKTYKFYKDTSLVGTYNYTVVKAPNGAQGNVYAMSSEIYITYEGKSITLEGLYRFDLSFRPVSYGLNVTQGDEMTYFVCDFRPGEVITTIRLRDETFEATTEIEDGTLLVENSMPGYWDVLLQSTSVQPGRRYTFNVFIPQAGRVFQLTLVVEKNLEQINVEGSVLECTVVKASEIGLAFYLHQGTLVQYRDDEQGVIINKVT